MSRWARENWNAFIARTNGCFWPKAEGAGSKGSFWPVSALRKRQVPPGAATQTINFLAGRDRLCGTSDPRSCLATATFQPNPLRERTCVGCSRPQGKLDSGVFLSGQCSELQLCGVVHLDLRTLLSQPKVSTKLGLYEHRSETLGRIFGIICGWSSDSSNTA